MARKKQKPEKIDAKLLQVDVLLSSAATGTTAVSRSYWAARLTGAMSCFDP